MSTVLSMKDHEPLSEMQAEYAAFVSGVLVASGGLVPVESPDHPGDVGLSLVDDEGQPTGQVVVVMHPDDVVEVGLVLPSEEELAEALAS